MTPSPDILCIGSVLWDIIGRTPDVLGHGGDVPGRITRQPGGVALNIAIALRRFGMTPALLGAVGTDAEGQALVAACRGMGLITDHLLVSDTLPTDRYMAIEAAGGLVAAIADAHSLEAAGSAILRPLADGRLGDAAAPWRGLIALDGNLTGALLAGIAADPLFALAYLRVAPASPGKALRLLPLLTHPRATLYLNIAEAGVLCQTRFSTAADAAAALLARGVQRVLVTDGARQTSEGSAAGIVSRQPPQVTVARVTGAGDTFMAAHVASEAGGATPDAAFERALQAAADHITGDNRP